MRVLHAYKIFRPEVMGGIPEAIFLLIEGMKSVTQSSVLVCRHKGHHRHLIIDGIAVEAARSFGTIFSSPLSPAYPFILNRRAREVDLVALHMPFPLSNIGIALGIPRDVALVVHWHSEIVGREALIPFFAPFINRTLTRAQRIIVSDRSLIQSSKFLAPHAEKCTVVPYGVDTTYWGDLNEVQRCNAHKLRARYPRLVITTGRLVPYKGHAMLLRALREINATVLIVGDGPLRKELMELGNRLGIRERIIFAGAASSEDLRTYLHAARVFALPSITIAEAFGIAQVEAMAAGLPVVNTGLPTGVPSVARHQLEGLTVPPSDHFALAHAIEQLLDDPELARRLGTAARERARNYFDMARFTAEVESVYIEAVSLLRTK